jgi:glutaredoxin
VATTLYSLASCPFCGDERERLAASGKKFTEIDVGDKPECVPELLKLTKKRRIVPVVVDGARIEIAPRGGTEF